MLIRPIPYRDPLAVAASFRADPHFVLLDGAADGRGRVSYLAADPFCVIEATHDRVLIDGQHDARDPFRVMEEQLALHAMRCDSAPAPFIGGAIGFLGYELGGRLERLPRPRPDTLVLPTLVMGFYDTVAAFDHTEQKAWILSSGRPEEKTVARDARAEMRASVFAARIAEAPHTLLPLDWNVRGEWQCELTRDEVERRIEKIIAYIHAGDIFQANFTQRFRARYPHDLDDFMLFRRLRALSPAPFAAFLRAGESLSIIGASPERFLRVAPDGLATAEPIKGTRPRSRDSAQDAELARALQESAKDHAENLMIVDLMRNDLSRVCVPGSVNVPRLCALESFASVHHLISTVTGRLEPGAGPVDLLRASFPGGSVTGAPKIRAMEIIRELEPAPRGVYCGCLGWIGFDGAMDMSMTIRTLTHAGDVLLAQAGGGIVADSDPAAEYEESMIKIAPLLQALSGETR